MSGSKTVIDERALTTVARAAVLSVPGTVEATRVAGRNLPRVDVRLDHGAGLANVEAFIAVTWPSPISDLGDAVRDAIIDHLHTYAGVETGRINVVVGELVHGRRVSNPIAPAAQLRYTPEAPKREPITPQVAKASWKSTREPVTKTKLDNPIEPRVHQVHTAKVIEPRVDRNLTANVHSVETPAQPSAAAPRSPELKDFAVALHPPKPSVAPGVPLVEISVPEPRPLREVKAPKPQRVQKVRAPRPAPLAEITIVPLTVESLRPRKAEARPLEVREPEARELPVRSPESKPLEVNEPEVKANEATVPAEISQSVHSEQATATKPVEVAEDNAAVTPLPAASQGAQAAAVDQHAQREAPAQKEVSTKEGDR